MLKQTDLSLNPGSTMTAVCVECRSHSPHRIPGLNAVKVPSEELGSVSPLSQDLCSEDILLRISGLGCCHPSALN